ncbi:trypsin-3 [Amyelois transitella]|uniref:trypsin-3 n=1 Tax=Amyelois transitella TaxID=680683 RepID=UPI00067CFD2B|nr:trypsin-3 [Amyelois transitella]
MLRVLLFVGFFNVIVKGYSWARISDESDSDEIVGGHEVDIEQFPYQVSLVYLESNVWNLHCSGSIISEEYVLTAAHCLSISPTSYKIRAGSTSFSEGGVLYNILSFTPHPKYKDDYDVGVIKTERMTINGVTTKIVQLAASGSALEPGQNILVSGWGYTENDAVSRVLKAVSLPVIGRKKCRQMFNEIPKPNVLPSITERMICAGVDETGQSACHGDSGGPAVDEDSLVQYGIVSFGDPGCMDPAIPNVYTNVPALRDWIKQQTGV